MREAPQDSYRIAAGMSRTSSRVVAGTSGFLSISDIDLGVSVNVEQGRQSWSCVEAWNSACLSSCEWGVRPLVELDLESVAFSRGCNQGVSAHSCVTQYSGLHSNRCRGIRPYVEWMGKSVSPGLWHDPRGFLSSFNVRPASS